MTDVVLAEALRLAEHGLRCFFTHGIRKDKHCTCGKPACSSAGKHPRYDGWKEQATSDPEGLRELRKRNVQGNVAIATGVGSGVVVVDVDGRSGRKSLIAIETESEPLPQTWTAKTGRSDGGQHLYFRYRPGIENQVGRTAPGLDVKTDGGLVIAPPSLHETGNRYAWELGCSPAECELADMPQWLYERLVAKEEEPRSNATRLVRITPNQGAVIPAYWTPAYWLEKYLAQAATGRRNNTGLLLAEQLLDSCIQTGNASENECIAAMREYARRVPQEGHPYSVEEALASWKSAREGIQERGFREPAGTTNPAPNVMQTDNRAVEIFHMTELGLAERFVARHGQDVRFVVEKGKGYWLLWNGIRWEPDRTLKIQGYAVEVVRSIYAEASEAEDKSERKALAGHASRSESKHAITAMIELAKSKLAIKPEDLDAQPDLLCTANALLDLRTEETVTPLRENLITKASPVTYDPRATCPTWEAFLERVQPDPEIRAFLQKAIGYTLTADASEHCIFFLHGDGRNGKSTAIEIIRELLGGDFSLKVGIECVTLGQRNKDSRRELADIPGKRYIHTAEIPKDARLDESLVKDLSGGDTVSGRKLFQEAVDFRVGAKLWAYGNHRFEIKGTDEAIWSRMRLIPFDVVIPAAERDRYLINKLKAKELPGILNWALEGARRWYRDGLQTPKIISAVTDEYRRQQDNLGGFFATWCRFGKGEKVTKKALWSKYREFATEAGEEESETQKEFNAEIRGRTGVMDDRGTGNKPIWRGVGLLDDPFPGTPEQGAPTELASESYQSYLEEADCIKPP